MSRFPTTSPARCRTRRPSRRCPAAAASSSARPLDRRLQRDRRDDESPAVHAARAALRARLARRCLGAARRRAVRAAHRPPTERRRRWIPTASPSAYDLPCLPGRRPGLPALRRPEGLRHQPVHLAPRSGPTAGPARRGGAANTGSSDASAGLYGCLGGARRGRPAAADPGDPGHATTGRCGGSAPAATATTRSGPSAVLTLRLAVAPTLRRRARASCRRTRSS